MKRRGWNPGTEGRTYVTMMVTVIRWIWPDRSVHRSVDVFRYDSCFVRQIQMRCFHQYPLSRSCLHLNLGVCCRFGAVRWSRFLAYIKRGPGHNTAGAQRRGACDRIRFTAVLVYLQTTERRVERGHDKFGSKHTRRHVIQWLDQPNHLSSYQRVPCAVEPPGRPTKG